MFEFNKIKVADTQILEAVLPCQVRVNCHFNANEDKDFSGMLIIIDFVHTISNGTKVMEKLTIASRRDPIKNVGQDDDYFWKDVKQTIYLEITCGYFSAFPREEKIAATEDVFKGIKDVVKTLGIKLQ